MRSLGVLRIRAELVGYGATADAYHITSPAPDGNGRSAPWSARSRRPAFLGDVIRQRHGTSTEAGDLAETNAIRRLRRNDAAGDSTKSMMGQCWRRWRGRSRCLRACDGELARAPTINLTDPDPACDLDYVPNTARAFDVNVAMSNSFGFGGQTPRSSSRSRKDRDDGAPPSAYLSSATTRVAWHSPSVSSAGISTTGSSEARADAPFSRREQRGLDASTSGLEFLGDSVWASSSPRSV